MAGYMVYWPGEQIRKLKKAKDTGPIRVVLGSIHSKMPSIASVKPGDVIYPVTLEKGVLYVMARLPVDVLLFFLSFFIQREFVYADKKLRRK